MWLQAHRNDGSIVLINMVHVRTAEVDKSDEHPKCRTRLSYGDYSLWVREPLYVIGEALEGHDEMECPSEEED